MSEALAILKKFEFQGISYVLLRNFEFFETEDAKDFPSDIDMLIQIKDKEIIADLLQREGYTLKKNIYHFTDQEAYIKYDPTIKKIVYLDIHYENLSWLGVPYLYGKEALQEKEKRHEFFILSKKHLLFSLFMHCVLEKRMFTDKYTSQINILKEDQDVMGYTLERINELFSKEVVKSLRTIIEDDKYTKYEKNKKTIITGFFVKNYLLIFTLLFHVFNWLKWKVRRLFSAGTVVSIIGIDGSGKTTITKEVSRALGSNHIAHSVVYLGRGSQNILPLQLFAKKYAEGTASESSKHDADKINKLKTLTLFVFFLDVFLRYIIYVLPKKLSGKIILTERSFTDFFIARGVPYSLRNLFYSLSPKPNILFFLETNALFAHQHKNEDSIEELERQITEYKKLLLKAKDVIMIPVTTIEQTASATLQSLFSNKRFL